MKTSLIVCTYERSHAVVKLLNSISKQTRIPFEILIIDSSLDNTTEKALNNLNFPLNIKYYLVDKDIRGLTKQRNFGVTEVSPDSELIAFLDDDLILEFNYFEEIINSFELFPEAIGVGGIDLNNNTYVPIHDNKKYSKFDYYILDGWVKKDPLRYKARKIFGLMANTQPGIIPNFSHGRSDFPPNGKIYNVEHFMGGISVYRKAIFQYINFSKYFEGYGLYEDFDFCIRAMKYGKLYVNTNARVWHYHEAGGRPNMFKYGTMVILNGWYIWKLRFPNNTFLAKIKWHSTSFLLAQIRLLNFIIGPNRKDALFEFLGRTFGWFSLWIKPPKIQK